MINQKTLAQIWFLVPPPVTAAVAYRRLSIASPYLVLPSAYPFGVVGRVLYGSGVFVILIPYRMLPRMIINPVTASWWAITYPSAAFAISTAEYYEEMQSKVLLAFVYVFSSIAWVFFLYVSIGTLWSLVTGEYFVDPRLDKYVVRTEEGSDEEAKNVDDALLEGEQ